MRSLMRSLPPIVCMGSPTDVMRLYELAYCCRAYAPLDSYDTATVALREATGDCVDPDDPAQLGPLFAWLRKWGCRQFVDLPAGGSSDVRMAAVRQRRPPTTLPTRAAHEEDVPGA